tara:strand:+ start:420 stop:641 length:222 start_codon:yes stop_codon:yes gene_type:complete
MIYVIYNTTDVASIDFNDIVQTSQETLRTSVDGTKTVLKFKGEMPDFLSGLPQYNHSDIASIMATAEWTTNSE